MRATELEAFTDLLVDDLTDRQLAGHGGSDEDVNDGTGLAGLLDGARAVVDDAALLSVMGAVVRLRNVVDGLLARVVAVAEEVGVVRRKRLKTGADLLAGFGVAPAAAHRAARVGREVPRLPGLETGLRNGFVSVEQADAVVKGVNLVGRRVELDDESRIAVATRLEVQLNPAAVAKRAREIALELAPACDGDAEERVPVGERVDLNEMTLVQTAEGRIEATLDVDVVTGEELMAALDPLMRPVPAPDGSRDQRSAAQRRADGFGQIVRGYLATGERPKSGGRLPHVSLILSREGKRVETGRPVASLGWTGPVSAATAEMTACDAEVRAFLVDGDGVPMNIGREVRLVPPGIRCGLEVRDRGCAFPGCGRPVSWCDAHHIRPWSEGGETSLANGVLLCRMHHTMVHHTGWEVFVGYDGHPWFAPPPGKDGRRPEAMRSHARRTLTALPRAS